MVSGLKLKSSEVGNMGASKRVRGFARKVMAAVLVMVFAVAMPLTTFANIEIHDNETIEISFSNEYSWTIHEFYTVEEFEEVYAEWYRNHLIDPIDWAVVPVRYVRYLEYP